MELHEAREYASDWFASVLETTFEQTSVEDIENAFGVEFEDAMFILFEAGRAVVEMGWAGEECTCDADDLADILLGDPDPTHSQVDDYDVCSVSNGRYLCTRLANHPGNHIAGDGVEVCAVWDD